MAIELEAPHGMMLGILLRGSRTYGLATPTSDWDYQILSLPITRELYSGKKAHTSDSVWDVRAFGGMLDRGSVPALELLYNKAEHVSLLPLFVNAIRVEHQEPNAKHHINVIKYLRSLKHLNNHKQRAHAWRQARFLLRIAHGHKTPLIEPQAQIYHEIRQGHAFDEQALIDELEAFMPVTQDSAGWLLAHDCMRYASTDSLQRAYKGGLEWTLKDGKPCPTLE